MTPSVANAESWEVGLQPHLEIGVTDYTLDVSATSQLIPQSGGATSSSKISFGATLPTLSAGLTLFADRYFLDLAVQRMQTLDQNVNDSNTITATSPTLFSTAQMNFETDDFSRDEYTMSLGYGITESVSIYAGYKKQYTTLNQLEGAGPAQIQQAGEQPFGTTFVTSGDYKFDYDGPFIGGTTSWKIASDTLKGRLAFNAAIAFLQGSLKVGSESAFFITKNGTSLPSNLKTSDIWDTSGDATGIALGASWLGQTDFAGLSYSLAINGYSYDFSPDDQGRADIGEDVLQLKVGVVYRL